MLEYPCLTSDPNQANAIYLPYYAAIDALRYLYGPEVNNSMEHGLELYDYLQDNEGWIWSRNHGADHFLVMSRPAWDFSQAVDVDPPIWGTSFLELPEFYNVTVLIVEGRAWPWQEQAVPYLTSFHPPNLGFLESWIKRVKVSKRTTLMLFAGGGGVGSTPNIRRSIRNECESSNFSSNSDIYVNNGEGFDYPEDEESFLQGIHPLGGRLLMGFLLGVYQFSLKNYLQSHNMAGICQKKCIGTFAVFIPKEDVVLKGLRILDVLTGIPRNEVLRMREKVIELIPRVLYRKHGSSSGLRARKDAFDIAVEGALQRIDSRLKGSDFDQ
ncbi:XYLOGLUCAN GALACTOSYLTRANSFERASE GT19-RELATED [Salix viminalis]|uniref:XYLOGLUCAN GALACTOSYLTRANSFERASE GT19-RELATED n=1 Tax=Salix viminalis TaxID=40686 RepID=A0A9Q0TMZ0_SALVM|nr:XYLOGLUCAN GALACTOSYLTRANSFERASE GT19-RELATED [Salix viminalis]